MRAREVFDFPQGHIQHINAVIAVLAMNLSRDGAKVGDISIRNVGNGLVLLVTAFGSLTGDDFGETAFVVGILWFSFALLDSILRDKGIW